MSETGRKMDVEDVLSSIRRLVSQEARNAHDDQPPADTPDPLDQSMLQSRNEPPKEKLVLTPSLRVSETISPPPIQAEIEQRIADIESLVMSEAVASAKAEIAESVEIQHPIDSPDDSSFEPNAEQDDTVSFQPHSNNDQKLAAPNSEMMAALHLSMRDFARAEPPLTANVANAPAVSTAPDDATSSATAPTEHDSAASLNTGAPEQVHSQTEWADSGVSSAEDPETKTDELPHIIETPLEQPDEPQDSFDAEVAEFYDIPAEDTPEAESALETPDPIHSAPDNNATSVDSNAPSAPQTESPFGAEPGYQAPDPEFAKFPKAEPEEHESREPFVHREPPLSAVPDDPTPDTAAAAEPLQEEPIDYTDGDDTFLDEESLREMVSDMVRSELQGELGDRITRNVRKLVRREIFRALASRDFE